MDGIDFNEIRGHQSMDQSSTRLLQDNGDALSPVTNPQLVHPFLQGIHGELLICQQFAMNRLTRKQVFAG
jgi:hypothetical protein